MNTIAVVRNLLVRAGADFSSARKEMHKFQKDVNDFKRNVSRTMKIAAAAIAAFATGKALRGSIAMYEEQLEMETKLAVVMRQRMKATDDVIQSIKNLASAQQNLGVIGDEVQLAGAQELATYLSDVKTLKTLMPVLNNLVAHQYGFTASSGNAVSMATMLGKVMDGQVGALSRYGYSFTEAEGKILKYGTEAQRAAVIAKLVQESVGNMNEALANTPAGRMQQLRNAFGDLKEEIGKSLAITRDAFVPMLMKIVQWATAIAVRFQQSAMFIRTFLAALTGRQLEDSSKSLAASGVAVGALSTGLEDAAKGYDNVEKSAKKAKKQLAGFDQLNTIGESSGGGAGSGIDVGNLSGISSDIEDAIRPLNGLADAMGTVSEKARLMGERVRAVISTMKDVIFSNKEIIIAALIGIGSAFAAAFVIKNAPVLLANIKTIGTVLGGLFTPIGVIAAAIGALIGAFVYFYRTNESFKGVVDGILEEIGEVAIWLWNAVLKPFGAWLASVFVKAWNVVTDAAMWLWKNCLIPLGNFLKWLWTNIFVPVGRILIDVLALGFKIVADVAVMLWKNVLVPLGEVLGSILVTAVKGLWAVLKDLWENVLKPIASFLGKVFINEFKNLISTLEFLWHKVLKPIISVLWSEFKPAFEGVFTSIEGIIRGLGKTLGGLINFIVGSFTGDWKLAWEGVRDIFGGIFDSLYNLVKIPLNLIITAINRVIDGLNKLSISVPDWVPEYGGKSFGINIPKIPKLAKGGLAFAPTLAMVGDNRNASIDPEVIAPLSKLKGLLGDQDNKEVVSVLQSILRAIREQDTDGLNSLSKSDLGRMASNGINKINRRSGKPLLNL